MARIVAFPYYGGKYYQLSWILSLLPECEHYVEPFCGSAIVALNRKPSPLETINDMNGDLINFFRVLRSNTEELVDQLELTMNSRAELELSTQPSDEPIERARRFFTRIRQSFSARSSLTSSSWSYSRRKTSATNSFRNSIPIIAGLVDRIKHWQIENRPAIDIIKRNDTEDALFYCDPPYVLSTRKCESYGEQEMSDDDHRELAEVLNSIKGRAAVSGYNCDLYNELYRNWLRYDKDAIVFASNKAKTEMGSRVESLWCNYG